VTAVGKGNVLEEEKVPCRQCIAGLHRVCAHPVPIPTLMAYVRGKKYSASETLTCCDRKEFWTRQLYP